ncbi:hypothetical protein M378DRAFT_67391 [Amanita muscaria Koide BX008]|uniref:uS12 prolyl 3,4-dihydroxylase n=1 Tax=Amanita muscaria (strain Koide BX008) TaxID=946122 RepID=A0A0C2T3C4_AMAMK|nr:hypothetical protein M378DRAFT_67391 [Amanita muscaria Koide BX008]
MPRTRTRSPSPAPTDPKKRRKTSHSPSSSDHARFFADGLFDHDNTAKLHKTYVSNSPFKYAIIDHLFQNDLLEKVKDECLSELNFTTKETDIYKINQTGDLASLNYLAPEQLALLSDLRVLRDALYSLKFRKFLQSVTGCGPLSGVKQDMSVNSYTKGCHLLNHDDVIGTRRVSYILYMPLPRHQMWQKDWGGALELYPVQPNEEGQLEPEPVPAKSIPPSWNQFILFQVQPGRSFHSVEEVVVGIGEDGRERLSISGWFHAAQKGEEGYEPLPESEFKSSREQLTSSSTSFTPYQEAVEDVVIPDVDSLSDSHITFLSEYLNPVYLKPRTMKALASRFVEESSLELHSFLAHDLAHALEDGLRKLDASHGLDGSRETRVPPHTSGADGAWAIKGPPHKWRYCVLKKLEEGGPVATVRPMARCSVEGIIRSLQDELFPSAPFRSWITLVSRLMPMKHHVEARRFRPGLDYTLATSEEKEARLDVVLGLTTEVQDNPAREEERGWSTGEWGGWECYMAPHDEEDDPAVYRSGPSKKPHVNGDAANGSAKQGPNGSTASSSGRPVSDAGSPRSNDDESTLLTVQPGFNRLLLVLRDERVMRFVKYVSADADGSRWDICGEYEVGMIESDEDVR